jgi:hypothetical protein
MLRNKLFNTQLHLCNTIMIMKNTTKLKGNRNEVKSKLKQQFTTPANGILLDIESKVDDLPDKAKPKSGKTKPKLKK